MMHWTLPLIFYCIPQLVAKILFSVVWYIWNLTFLIFSIYFQCHSDVASRWVWGEKALLFFNIRSSQGIEKLIQATAETDQLVRKAKPCEPGTVLFRWSFLVGSHFAGATKNRLPIPSFMSKRGDSTYLPAYLLPTYIDTYLPMRNLIIIKKTDTSWKR